MTWTPPSMLSRLSDAFLGLDDPHAGEGPPLASIEGPNGKTWTRCPNCSRRVPLSVMVDLRGIAEIEEQWACDGCWSQWVREGREIGGEPLTKRRWCEIVGAPVEVQERFAEAGPEAHIP